MIIVRIIVVDVAIVSGGGDDGSGCNDVRGIWQCANT